MFKGKKLSILGDSISTYQGVSNDEKTNAMLFYNPVFYREPFPLEKTYWMLLINKLGMELCVNNSWSGGNLSDTGNPDSGVNRVRYLATNDGEKPDYIIVFMGINDLGRNVPVNRFEADYTQTLTTIKECYPGAKVCCVNLPDRCPYFKSRTVLFNQAIDHAVANAGEGFFVADLFGSELNNDVYYDNTLDWLHPAESGARMIFEVVADAFETFSKRLTERNGG